MRTYLIHVKLLGMAVLWGASWPMGRILGQSLPPLTGGAVRFLLASVLLSGWLFARSRFAAVAGFGGCRLVRRVRVCRILHVGPAADAGRQSRGRHEREPGVDAAVGGVVVRGIFEYKNPDGYVADRRRCGYCGYAG